MLNNVSPLALALSLFLARYNSYGGAHLVPSEFTQNTLEIAWVRGSILSRRVVSALSDLRIPMLTCDNMLTGRDQESIILVLPQDALRALKLIKKHCGFPILNARLIDYQDAKRASALKQSSSIR